MTAVQKRNGEMVQLLTSDFQARGEPNFAIGNAVSTFLMLPELRGFWPFSSINESGNAYDLSGQGRILTNNGAVARGVAGLAPYVNPTGANYFSRADEAGFDITGNLSVCGWFYSGAFSAPASANTCMAKSSNAAPNLGYILDFLNSVGPINQVRFFVSSDGTDFDQVLSTDQVVINTWYFLGGRYTPSTEIALFKNRDKYTNVVGIPAALVNNARAFTVGALSTPANYLTGRAGLCAIGAALWSDAVFRNLFEQTRGMFGV